MRRLQTLGGAQPLRSVEIQTVAVSGGLQLGCAEAHAAAGSVCRQRGGGVGVGVSNLRENGGQSLA